MANRGKSLFKSVPKAHKIDIHQSYPCPLCRGKLLPIALTDALGCDRCHLIFVVNEDGYALSQLDISSRIWFWLGDQWQISSKVREHQHFVQLDAVRFILVLALVILLCLLTKTPEFVLGVSLIILLLWISWRFLPHNF